jgi:RNA polymerase sigma factor (sigma-70 family)
MSPAKAATLEMIGALAMSSQIDGARGEATDIKGLTNRIICGDEEAFDLFYQAYASRLFRFAIILTSGDEAASSDLQQAVLLKAARKMKLFATDEQLWAWLTQIARNHRLDSLRRQARENRFLSLFRAVPPGPVLQSEDTLVEDLQSELINLDPDERSLVECFYFEKCSQQEIAEQTGRTAKAVQCELARIRTKLKTMLLRRLKDE